MIDKADKEFLTVRVLVRLHQSLLCCRTANVTVYGGCPGCSLINKALRTDAHTILVHSSIQYVKHLQTDQTRYIITMRNPTQRVLSHYFYLFKTVSSIAASLDCHPQELPTLPLQVVSIRTASMTFRVTGTSPHNDYEINNLIISLASITFTVSVILPHCMVRQLQSREIDEGNKSIFIIAINGVIIDLISTIIYQGCIHRGCYQGFALPPLTSDNIVAQTEFKHSLNSVSVRFTHIREVQISTLTRVLNA